MGGFYSGATAQPLQRQTILGSGVDMPDMSGGYAAPAQAPSLGQPTSGPSRFQSILGSLGQLNQGRGSGSQQNQGVADRLIGFGKNTGLFTL